MKLGKLIADIISLNARRKILDCSNQILSDELNNKSYSHIESIVYEGIELKISTRQYEISDPIDICVMDKFNKFYFRGSEQTFIQTV